MKDNIMPYYLLTIGIALFVIMIIGMSFEYGYSCGRYNFQKEAVTEGYGSFEVIDNKVEFKWKE